MNKILILILILLMNIFLISASCEEGQIDINNAQKQGLIEIVYIGEVRAEALILLRPFTSLDELIKINGIGEVYLTKIKEQGLACVDEEIKESEEEPNEEEKQEEKKEEEENEEEIEIKETKDIQKTPIQPSIIELNSKDIKTEDNKEESTKNKYAQYGFVAFCVLLGFLFIFKKRKNRNKNEFEA